MSIENPKLVRVAFEMPFEDLKTAAELLENYIMDLEDDGRDDSEEAKILRDLWKPIRRGTEGENSK